MNDFDCKYSTILKVHKKGVVDKRFPLCGSGGQYKEDWNEVSCQYYIDHPYNTVTNDGNLNTPEKVQKFYEYQCVASKMRYYPYYSGNFPTSFDQRFICKYCYKYEKP